MRLTALEPEFIRWNDVVAGYPHMKPEGGQFGDPYPHTALQTVSSLAEAQGIIFLCPACYARNGGVKGTL